MESISLELHVLGQALLALLLGGVVGWERETAGKGVGLRTNMLVCLAAMMFVQAGEFLIMHVDAKVHIAALRTDPVRVIEAIVTGISFIGAGTVFRDRQDHPAHGLTTAAALLAVATIGISVAVERYILAVGVTAMTLLVLRGVRQFEAHVRKPGATTKDE